MLTQRPSRDRPRTRVATRVALGYTGAVPRWLKLTLSLLGVLALGFVLWFHSVDLPRPRGRRGPEAEALAARMMAAANIDAWRRTAAVRWSFRGARHHLWDRKRQLAEVRFGEERVLLHLDTRQGLAYHAGLPLEGVEGRSALRKAYRAWVNDSFWLNPIAKLYDPGVKRETASGPDGRRGLLVSYTRGGLTPGDAYLWLVGDDGLPDAWRMWVSILPIGGLRASWERWQTLQTGARISTLHKLGPVWVTLSDLAGAHDLATLTGGDDPFQPLLAHDQHAARSR